jgi:hypothetical protein
VRPVSSSVPRRLGACCSSRSSGGVTSARRIGGRRVGREPAAADLCRPLRACLPAGLNDYWKAYYLLVDQGWAAISHNMVRGGQQRASYLGMGPLVVALLPAARRDCHAGLAPPNARRTRRTRPAGEYRRARRARAVPAVQRAHPHFLRSSDFVRVLVARAIELCVATLRECNHRSCGRVH